MYLSYFENLQFLKMTKKIVIKAMVNFLLNVSATEDNNIIICISRDRVQSKTNCYAAVVNLIVTVKLQIVFVFQNVMVKVKQDAGVWEFI